MSKELLRDVAVAKERNIPVATLRNLRTTGGGPPFFKIGGAVRYTLEDVDAWLETTRVASTSEYRDRSLA
jgi:hypothetical protein